MRRVYISSVRRDFTTSASRVLKLSSKRIVVGRYLFYKKRLSNGVTYKRIELR